MRINSCQTTDRGKGFETRPHTRGGPMVCRPTQAAAPAATDGAIHRPYQPPTHLSEELDGGVRVLDKHLRAEPELLPHQIKVLWVDSLLPVRVPPLEGLHAPQAALPAGGHRPDAILPDVDHVLLFFQKKKKKKHSLLHIFQEKAREKQERVVRGECVSFALPRDFGLAHERMVLRTAVYFPRVHSGTAWQNCTRCVRRSTRGRSIAPQKIAYCTKLPTQAARAVLDSCRHIFPTSILPMTAGDFQVDLHHQQRTASNTPNQGHDGQTPHLRSGVVTQGVIGQIFPEPLRGLYERHLLRHDHNKHAGVPSTTGATRGVEKTGERFQRLLSPSGRGQAWCGSTMLHWRCGLQLHQSETEQHDTPTAPVR